MLSASAFNLDWAKICLFGNELKLSKLETFQDNKKIWLRNYGMSLKGQRNLCEGEKASYF